MGLFEEYPLLLIPFVLAVVVAYDLLKALAKTAYKWRQKSERLNRP